MTYKSPDSQERASVASLTKTQSMGSTRNFSISASMQAGRPKPPPIYKTTLGSSPYSHRRSSSAFCFGQETDSSRHARFIGQGAAVHDPTLLTWVPGPGAYDLPGGMGRTSRIFSPAGSPSTALRASGAGRGFSPSPSGRTRTDAKGTGDISTTSCLAPSSLSCGPESALRGSWGPGPPKLNLNSNSDDSPGLYSSTISRPRVYPLDANSERGTYYVNGGGLNSGVSLSQTGRPSVQSTMRSPERVGWSGYSYRETETSRYLDRGHERERLGYFSPGPTTAAPEAYASVGARTSSSRIKYAPRMMFPRSSRFVKVCKAADTTAWPGPGAYDC